MPRKNTEREVRHQQFKLECREATEEERAAGKIGVLYGDAVVYNKRTELWPGMTEEVKPGAFTEALDKEDQDVRALFNHDTNHLLGRRSAGTLRLKDGPRALEMEIDVPDTSTGRDVLVSTRRGDLDGQSFSFSLRHNGQRLTGDEDNTHRELLALNLYDVGPVTFPQYTDTTVAARTVADLAVERERSEVARRAAERERELQLLGSKAPGETPKPGSA